jgi:endonuclease III
LPGLSRILDELAAFHGKQELRWPTDPYLFLVWWHCGYPPSEERCSRGWEALSRAVGVAPEQLLATRASRVTAALAAGGLVPELRASRLQAIARRVRDEFGGDLQSALERLDDRTRRRIVKAFPGIADAGADRILLFAGLAPVAAVPSNCPHVLVRIVSGREPDSYAATYAQAQSILEARVPQTFTALRRAYLLLQQHGRQLCKRTRPRCDDCPLAQSCTYASHRARYA